MTEHSLYSKEQIFLHSVDSVLRGDRIFNGSQTDDFALVNLKNNKKILLLGGGQGGALRPFLINNPETEVYVVDLDENNIAITNAIHNKYFPFISRNIKFFDINAENIYDFFEGYQFDCICIDLYTNIGYPEFVFTINYLKKIKSLLSDNGLVILNAFGLPDHLHPLQGNNPQIYILGLLNQVFNNISYISNRRNMTMVSSMDDTPISLGKPDVKLNSHDLLAYNMLNLRWKSRFKIDKPINPGYLKPDILTKTFLNEEMFLRWDTLLNVLNKYMIDKQEPLTIQNLRDCVLNKREIFLQLTIDLLRDKRIEASFLPIYLGSLSYNIKYDFSWFIEWFITNKSFIMKNHLEWGVHFGLTQIVSIIINQYGKYDDFINDINSIIQEKGFCYESSLWK
ncbi:hypothetical protein CN424_08635 [Bacillus cereus]|nr:hypothetical protein CN424_08635 [Bacillus cereus]PFB74575.1 hypothetical protein CN286_27530 [Bacillus anthracis]